MRSQLLAAAAVLLTAGPTFAAVNPPPASKADAHMRSVRYDANNPIELDTTPGVSLRIILAPDEEVERVIVSDEGIMKPEPDVDTASPQVSSVSATINGAVGTVSNLGTNQNGNQNGGKLPTCDPNLCRDVTGNIVYLKPLRSLDPQPLFIHTVRHDPITGQTERVPYAFVLTSHGEDTKAATAASTLWSVTLTYPEREAAARRVAAQKAAEARAAAWRERQALRPPSEAAHAATDNRRYGYKGSAAVMPDMNGVHDDGRTTFLRFDGNQRVPNVYRILPDGKRGLARSTTEPDATGTTLRIAGTERVWILADGTETGCVINGGSDPEGRTAATVASVQDDPR